LALTPKGPRPFLPIFLWINQEFLPWSRVLTYIQKKCHKAQSCCSKLEIQTLMQQFLNSDFLHHCLLSGPCDSSRPHINSMWEILDFTLQTEQTTNRLKRAPPQLAPTSILNPVPTLSLPSYPPGPHPIATRITQRVFHAADNPQSPARHSMQIAPSPFSPSILLSDSVFAGASSAMRSIVCNAELPFVVSIGFVQGCWSSQISRDAPLSLAPLHVGAALLIFAIVVIIITAAVFFFAAILLLFSRLHTTSATFALSIAPPAALPHPGKLLPPPTHQHLRFSFVISFFGPCQKQLVVRILFFRFHSAVCTVLPCTMFPS
jgi:hypothetical protein